MVGDDQEDAIRIFFMLHKQVPGLEQIRHFSYSTPVKVIR